MMKIGKLLVLITCFNSTVGSAQMIYPGYSDSSISHAIIETDGIFDLQGSAIKREFSNTLLFGGFIDEGMKGRSFEKHSAVNRFGINANAEIRYINGGGGFMKRDSVAWMIKGGYFALGNLIYGQDAFGLLFYGNESYLNTTADFSNTRLDFAQFQKIGFGIVNKKNKSSVTLNVVNVQNYVDGTIRKGELTQNEDGSQINLDIQGNMLATTGANFNKGLGLSLDVDYRILVPWGKSTTTFQVMAQNMGAAYIYNGMQKIAVDSNYSYSGFDFETLTSDSNPFGDDFSIIDSLGIEKRDVKRFVPLPGYVQVAKLVDVTSAKKVQSFFGIRLYPTFSSIPQLFAGAYWKPTELLHVAGSVTYGGFGNFRGGLFLTLNLKQVNWMLGTEDVFGGVSKKGYGESLVTKLIWKINS